MIDKEVKGISFLYLHQSQGECLFSSLQPFSAQFTSLTTSSEMMTSASPSPLSENIIFSLPWISIVSFRAESVSVVDKSQPVLRLLLLIPRVICIVMTNLTGRCGPGLFRARLTLPSATPVHQRSMEFHSSDFHQPNRSW